MNTNNKNFGIEITEILNNIRAVKGKEYGDVLRVIFTLGNYAMASTELMKGMAEKIGGEELISGAANMSAAFDVTVHDVINVLLCQLVRAKEGESEEASSDRVMAKLNELLKDVKTLGDKQDQYGSFALGGVM